MQRHNDTLILWGKICLPNRRTIPYNRRVQNGNTVKYSLKDANVNKVQKKIVLTETQANRL
jgi:hypothetical protein